MDAYNFLAAAIIRQALEDYKKSLENIRKKFDVVNSECTVYEVRKFLRSEWFRTLSDMNAEKLIELMEEDFA